MSSNIGAQNFDSKGWNIDLEQLPSPKRGVHPYNYFFDEIIESPDKKYACVFYTVIEYRMGAYAGLVAIFKNKENPLIILSSKDEWYDYGFDHSAIFFDDLLFLRLLAYSKDKNLSGIPFIVFNLKNEVFGVVDFDWSSIYYSPVKVLNTSFKFELNTPSELGDSPFNKQFDISKIKYYPFSDANKLRELYVNEKASG